MPPRTAGACKTGDGLWQVDGMGKMRLAPDGDGSAEAAIGGGCGRRALVSARRSIDGRLEEDTVEYTIPAVFRIAQARLDCLASPGAKKDSIFRE